MKHSILCVDDEPDIVEALERLLRKKYRIVKALSGAEGLEVLKKEKISLVLCDQRMPKMTGVQFLSKSIKFNPDMIRILLTGYTDVESVIESINSGQIYRYITKPWDPIDLANTVDKAIEKYELSEELKVKNAELEKALAELRTLDEAKNQFMIVINHELKTPLTVMLSYLQLLEDTKMTEEQDKYFARVHTGALRLQTLINDVLELISAETGLVKLSPKKLLLKEVFSGTWEALAKEAVAKGLSVDFDLDIATAKFDEKILRSVTHRLFDNAVKFGEANSTVKVTSLKRDDGSVEVSIVNKGKSLSKVDIEKILKPFTLDEDVMNHTKGAGLGLSICRALLKAHDTELFIECPKGEFAASFTLPT